VLRQLPENPQAFRGICRSISRTLEPIGHFLLDFPISISVFHHPIGNKPALLRKIFRSLRKFPRYLRKCKPLKELRYL
jgi:hypothetical protein